MFATTVERIPRRFSHVLFASMLLPGFVFSAGTIVILVQVEIAMEEISLHHWLDAEARHYTEQWHSVGEQASLPNMLEFDLWRDDVARPQWLAGYQRPGFHEHQLGSEDKHFLVTPHPSGAGLMYLVFKDDADDYLDDYEGHLHLLGVLLALGGLLASVLASFLLTQRLSRPLQAVEHKVRSLTPSGALITVNAPFVELRSIETTLAEVQREVSGYLRREREFSRFASHELRTPLTVVQGSAEALTRMIDEQAPGRRALVRIDSACRDMTVLIETFLLLGRSEAVGERVVSVDVETLLIELVGTAGARRGDRTMSVPVEIMRDNLADSECLRVQAPQHFMRVLLGNLIRNAVAYSHGPVVIHLGRYCLMMRNPYTSSDNEVHGYGYGLVICERICERMGWQMTVTNDKRCFEVCVNFE